MISMGLIGNNFLEFYRILKIGCLRCIINTRFILVKKEFILEPILAMVIIVKTNNCIKAVNNLSKIVSKLMKSNVIVEARFIICIL